MDKLRPGALVSALSVAALAAVLASGANAGTVSIGLSTGGPITNVASATNNVVFSGAFGAFIINNISASGDGGLPFPDLLNSTALDTRLTGTGASTLDVFVTVQGLTLPLGSLTGFVSSFTQNSLTAGWSVTQSTFLDAGNGVFTLTTPLNTHTFSAIGTNVGSNTVATGPGPYSLTEEFIISASGTGSASSTTDISAVPEPATWAMMLLGFVGLGFAFRQSRRKVSFA